MRQTIFIIPLFVLLLALLSWFLPQMPGRVSHEAFIDETALVVISQRQLSRHIDDLVVSPLGNTMLTLDYASILRELSIVHDDQATVVASIQQGFADAINDPLIRSIIGRSVTVALMPFVFDPEQPLVDQLLDHLIIVCRPRQSGHLLELLRRLSGTAAYEEFAYGGHRIRRFGTTTDMRWIVAAHVGSLSLVTFNERLLRSCLDLHDDRAGSLAASTDYRTGKKAVADASFYAYLNLHALSAILDNLPSPSAPSETGWRRSERQRQDLYRSGYFGGWQTSDTRREKIVLNFREDRVPPALHSLFHSKPATTRSVQHVSADTIWYYWTNSYSPESLIELFSGQLEDETRAKLSAVVARISAAAQITPQQLVDALANDLLIAMEKFDRQEILPLPRVLVAIRCNDVNLLKRLIEELIADYAIPVQRRTLQGQDIISWGGVIPMSGFSPSLAFVDDYLVLANNIKQIKEYIDFPEDQIRLADSMLFQLVDHDGDSKNNTVQFVNVSELADQARELVGWIGMVLAITDRDSADKSKFIIDRVVNPLLQGLRTYGVVGTRKYVSGDQVVMEIVTAQEKNK